ncbi:hypothetical protein GQ457_07G003900 [Hibiscus cannabinus]
MTHKIGANFEDDHVDDVHDLNASLASERMKWRSPSKENTQEDIMNVRIINFIPMLQFVGLSKNKLIWKKLRDHTHLYGSSKLMKARGSAENKRALTKELPRG